MKTNVNGRTQIVIKDNPDDSSRRKTVGCALECKAIPKEVSWHGSPFKEFIGKPETIMHQHLVQRYSPLAGTSGEPLLSFVKEAEPTAVFFFGASAWVQIVHPKTLEPMYLKDSTPSRRELVQWIGKRASLSDETVEVMRMIAGVHDHVPQNLGCFMNSGDFGLITSLEYAIQTNGSDAGKEIINKLPEGWRDSVPVYHAYNGDLLIMSRVGNLAWVRWPTLRLKEAYRDIDLFLSDYFSHKNRGHLVSSKKWSGGRLPRCVKEEQDGGPLRGNKSIIGIW